MVCTLAGAVMVAVGKWAVSEYTFEVEPAGFADITATYGGEPWIRGVREREEPEMTAEFSPSRWEDGVHDREKGWQRSRCGAAASVVLFLHLAINSDTNERLTMCQMVVQVLHI